MTKDEMQRYLIQQAQEGAPELKAYQNLMEVLGLEYPAEKNKDNDNKETGD